MAKELTDIKARVRKAALARRKVAKSSERDAAAVEHLRAALLPHQGKPIAGYMPIRTEIDPLPVMASMTAFGPVGVPVIQAEGAALKFRQWSPGCAMIDGPFGAQVPASGAWIVPQIVIVPLVAFDREGGRLGYGGGFYDRTLEGLRLKASTLAIGYAYSAQEEDSLPLEPTDQPLDIIVTEEGIIALGP